MKGLENIKNFSLFENSKITWKNILKYYVTDSEVTEQCLCLAASVLEAACLGTPSRQPNTQRCPNTSRAAKTKAKPQKWSVVTPKGCSVPTISTQVTAVLSSFQMWKRMSSSEKIFIIAKDDCYSFLFLETWAHF